MHRTVGFAQWCLADVSRRRFAIVVTGLSRVLQDHHSLPGSGVSRLDFTQSSGAPGCFETRWVLGQCTGRLFKPPPHLSAQCMTAASRGPLRVLRHVHGDRRQGEYSTLSSVGNIVMLTTHLETQLGTDYPTRVSRVQKYFYCSIDLAPL